MKTRIFSTPVGICRTLFTTGLLLLPSIALAHPGHYHPGEEDEFDALRANFLHLHGTLEIGVACIGMASAIVFIINRNKPVRITAAIALSTSLAFLAAH